MGAMPGRVASLLLVLLLGGPTARGDVPGPLELRDAVDADRLRSHLRALTGHDPVTDGDDEVLLRTRNIHHPNHAVAGAWIAARFAAIPGMSVNRELFITPTTDDTFNVVARLVGDDPALPIVVVGAHYDSIASATEGWDEATDPAPGADDDASGVAALLEVARVLAAHPGGTRRTVAFVAFSAEEYGLLGSRYHVASLRELREEVELMLSLDPIGYDPGGSSAVWVVHDERWPEPADRSEALAAAQGGRLTVTTIDADLIGGDARSDHFPFWEAGHPALHIASFPQPPTYHTVGDDLDVVDPAFHFEVTALVTALVAETAELLEPPEDEGGCGAHVAAASAAPGAGWAALLAGLAALGRRRR